MSKRATLYARVSTDDQRNNYSVPTQLSAELSYVKDKGYTVVGDLWVDSETGLDTKSGTGIQAYVDDYTSRELSRPALDAALRYLESSGFDVLVIHAIDRLARDPYIRQTLEREFAKRGAKVEFVLGNYDETPEGEVRKDLDATFAKWENAKRVERVTRGRRGKAERGLFVSGHVPFGYRIDKMTSGGLAIVESKAAIVRRVFDEYVNKGQSIRSIAQMLSNEGVINDSGHTQWAKSSIARMLANETYAGTCYFNKFERKGNHLTLRPRTEWIVIPVLPIVGRSLYDLAQTKLSENREIVRSQPRRFYLLRGMVFCAQCDHVYSAQTQRAGRNRRIHDAPAYRHRIKDGHCTNRHISARTLEIDVWATVAAAIMNPDELREGYAEAIKRDLAIRERKQAHLEELRAASVKLERQRDNLNSAYIDPDVKLSKTEYLKQKVRLDEALKGLDQQMADGQEELTREEPPVDIETFDRFVEEIRQALAENVNPDPTEKRRILEMLHVKVMMESNGKHRVKGAFRSSNAEDCDSLSSTTSGSCVLPPPPLPARV